MSIPINLFPNRYPWMIFLSISNSDIPEYIQTTYPRPISEKDILRLFIDILSYPSNLSWKHIHVYIQQWYPWMYPWQISMSNILNISYLLPYSILLYSLGQQVSKACTMRSSWPSAEAFRYCDPVTPCLQECLNLCVSWSFQGLAPLNPWAVLSITVRSAPVELVLTKDSKTSFVGWLHHDDLYYT
jgi:hypothetical protein